MTNKILNNIGRKVPTKKSLHQGEAQIVELRPGQLSPVDNGGQFLYVNVKGELFRIEAKRVEWEP